MSTNGTHAATGSESPDGALREHPPVDPHSVDERLDALRATIRTWDWREALVEVGPPRIDALDDSAPPLHATSPADAHRVSESLEEDELSRDDRAGPQSAAMSASPDPAATAASPMETAVLPLDVEAPGLDEPVVPPPTAAAVPQSQATTRSDEETPSKEPIAPPPAEDAGSNEATESAPAGINGPVTEEIAIPTEAPAAVPLVDHAAREPGSQADGVGTSWFGQEPEQSAEPERGRRRFWSRPSAKLAVAIIAAAVVVALIVGGIRFFAKNPASGGTTETTVSQPSSHSARHTHFVAPISAAQLATYEGFASSFQNANVTATKAFVKAGSTPTAAQVVLAVVAYRTAVNIYNYQLHFVQWPQSMVRTIDTDHAQLQALASFLQAFSSIAPNGVPAWLSQLNNRASSTQDADNAVRQDLGLSASSAFP